MITTVPHNYNTRADSKADCSFGNVLFSIAGTIGIAAKNRYPYGFYNWANQDFFVNKLPKIDVTNFIPYQIPINYKGYDIGFQGFDVPNNVRIMGYLGSWKYFEHCEGLIRYYFTMKELCKPYKDCIIVHCRNYSLKTTVMPRLSREYYLSALKRMPDKKVMVITDNIKEARKTLGEDFEYVSNTPIVDFYLMTRADYLVMSNSTFSWWGAWLSRAKTIAPLNWYGGEFKDCSTKDLYCNNWELI